MYIFDIVIGLGDFLTACGVVYIAWKQYSLDSKKYHTDLRFDVESLKNHVSDCGSIITGGPGPIEYPTEYLTLVNYGDGYAKNIAITLKHVLYNYGTNPYKEIKERSENISLLGPWSTSKVFKGKIGIPGTYNKKDKLEFDYSYTDGIGKTHNGKLSYIIQENYILEPQNNS